MRAVRVCHGSFAPILSVVGLQDEGTPSVTPTDQCHNGDKSFKRLEINAMNG